MVMLLTQMVCVGWIIIANAFAEINANQVIHFQKRYYSPSFPIILIIYFRQMLISIIGTFSFCQDLFKFLKWYHSYSLYCKYRVTIFHLSSLVSDSFLIFYSTSPTISLPLLLLSDCILMQTVCFTTSANWFNFFFLTHLSHNVLRYAP